jgi:hypothetical protein
VIVLGVILALIGFLVGPAILLTIGVIVLVVGLIFFALDMSGRPVGGRRWY